MRTTRKKRLLGLLLALVLVLGLLPATALPARAEPEGEEPSSNTVAIGYSGYVYQISKGTVKAISEGPYTFNQLTIINADVQSATVIKSEENKTIVVNIFLAPETEIGTVVQTNLDFTYAPPFKKLKQFPRVSDKYYNEYSSDTDRSIALTEANSLQSVSAVITSKTAVSSKCFYLYEASDYTIPEYIVSVTLNFLVANYSDGPDKAEVTGLAIAQQPEKTTYIAGEYFDPKGLLLQAELTGGTQSEPFHECTWEPGGPLQSSDTQITLTYGTRQIVLPITVLATNTLLDAEILNNAGVFIYKPYLLDENQKEIIGSEVQKSEKGIGKIVAPYGASEVQIKLTLANGDTTVYIGDSEQTKEADPKECIITVPSSDEVLGETTLVTLKAAGQEDKTYTFICYSQLFDELPDAVVDYLCIASQFSNGGNTYNPYIGINGIATLIGNASVMNGSLSGPPTSLGNFGGYITYYYEDAITDDPNNPYGIDFIVFGNPYLPNDNYFEPGIVMVSEDGKTWYTLAGSDHYEDYMVWDYQVTYSEGPNGKTAWSDNYGNSDVTVYDYVDKERYPLYFNNHPDEDTINLSGTLISWSDSDTNAEYGKLVFFPQFGYVDKGAWSGKTNQAGNPYEMLVLNPNFGFVSTSITDGFDLAWAVDENGDPVNLPNGIHYIKIQTAQFNGASSTFGEPSPEINFVVTAMSADEAVGTTDAPTKITVDGVEVQFAEGSASCNATISGPFAVEVTAGEGANILINSYRSSRREYNEMPEHKMLRIIVQEGEKAPWIGMIHLAESNETKYIHNVTFDVGTTSSGAKLGSIYGGDLRADDGVSVLVRKYDEGMNGALLPVPWMSTDYSKSLSFVGWQYGIGIYTTYDHDKIPDGATLTAVYAPVEGAESSATDITVSFRLVGSTRASADVNLANGSFNGAEYKPWVPAKEYTVSGGSTVLDVLEAAVSGTGITFENGGNYISSITVPEALGGYTLAAMDNGKRSGWMFQIRHAGEEDYHHGTYGVAQQTLLDGDEIVFHYVNDYSYEVDDWAEIGGVGFPALGDGTYYNGWLKVADPEPEPEPGTGSGSGTGTGTGTESGTGTGTEPQPEPDPAPEFDDTPLGRAAAYIYGSVKAPTLAQTGGEWAVLGLARSGYAIPEAYYAGYYTRLLEKLTEKNGDLGRGYTEYERVILALTAIGKNPADAGGFDLLARLADYDKTVWQGNNSVIFALLALDAGNYDIPENADAAVRATRQKYLDLLLANQLDNGGWTKDSTGGAGDASVDITAMALQALAKYRDRAAAASAVDKALSCLSGLQNPDGGFNYGSEGATAESAAQVLVALNELGIPLNDSRFVKNGKTVLDALLTYQNEDGSFRHTAAETGANLMSTEQAFYALVSAWRAEKGMSTLYTMSDPAGTGSGEPTEPVEEPTQPTQPTEPGGESGKKTITVYFTLLGDKAHNSDADGQAHGLVMGGLETWIPRTAYSLEEGAYVKDLFELALTQAGMSWSNPGGNYVEDITYNGVTLGEFTNGKNSGWMYTLNGSKHPSNGLAKQDLKDGDSVVWHYTDDYALEEGLWNAVDGAAGTGSGSTDGSADAAAPEITENTVTVAAETADDGEAKAEIAAETVAEALKNTEEEVLTVKVDTEDAESVELSLSAQAVQAAAEGAVDLHIETEQGTVKLDAGTLSELAETGADIAVTVTAGEDGGFTLDVTADGETVDAKIKVELPAAEDSQVLVIVNADGSEEVIKKSVVEDGKVYAELPAGATVKVVENDKDFEDVDEEAWYAEAVEFASSHELFQGVSATEFAPEDNMTRAMLVTVLFRLEDQPETAGETSFGDVTDGAWYTDAVAWASETGLVNGTDKGFEPNENVSREQIAAILYRYAGYIGLDTTVKGDVSKFGDAGEISPWAKDAMAWAVEVGLFQGDGSKLDPKGDATRGQVAALMQRLIGLIVK